MRYRSPPLDNVSGDYFSHFLGRFILVTDRELKVNLQNKRKHQFITSLSCITKGRDWTVVTLMACFFF